VSISDASGCISESNIAGSLFRDGLQPFLPLLDSVSVNANGSVTLGWEPSPSLDAVMYYIYKETAGGIWLVLDSVAGYNNTSYTYTGSAAGSGSENFCIAARDSCRNVSILGNGDAQKTIYLTSKFNLCSRSVDLTWTAYVNLPKGILLYDVYCSINAGVFNLVGSSGSTSFTHQNLNPGDTYCYYVKVRNTDRSISANSNRSCIIANAPSGPSFVYLKSVSVNTGQTMDVVYAVDTLKPYKGAIIFKSEDGITFTQLKINYSVSNFIESIVDTDVKPSEKNYYYKVQLLDSCGNPGMVSNISKSVVLNVTHDTERLFYNTLTWDDYASWSGSVASYNIYRAVNGVFDPTPISNVSVGTRTYEDNVESYVSDQGKFSYYVEAVEGSGNIYGFTDKARSNFADAYVEAEIFVPNAFAPKGINNVWLPVSQYVEKTDYKVMVFNRWGTKVFQTNSDTEGWSGNNATDEVYVYIIEYKNARGEYIQLKGHLNLVK
jgi:gliding motility-associated-like protein